MFKPKKRFFALAERRFFFAAPKATSFDNIKKTDSKNPVYQSTNGIQSHLKERL
jgi:hypothetical protein